MKFAILSLDGAEKTTAKYENFKIHKKDFGLLIWKKGSNLHFRFAKTIVAASVCPDGRTCPPDSSTAMGSNPVTHKRLTPEEQKSFGC